MSVKCITPFGTMHFLVPRILFVILVLSLCSPLGFCQQTDGCPKSYVAYGDSCYNFVTSPRLTFQEATIACQHLGSTLVSVRSASQNKFLTDWLLRHDSNRNVWLTSALRSNGELRWTSDQQVITDHFFASDDVMDTKRMDTLANVAYNLIVYKYSPADRKFSWEWGRIMVLSSYICELKKSDVWKFYLQARDFSFGTGITDHAEWPTGPNITVQSKDTVFVQNGDGSTSPFNLECVAIGNPPPTYKWFRGTPGRPLTEIKSSSQYAISNGKLKLNRPNSDDVGSYTCLAENIHGKVMSNPIEVSVGQLGEFSNVPTSETRARMYTGVEIACNPPVFKPEARFNWYKENVRHFVRPKYNKHTFISMNGKLYISEVSAQDAGDYFCMVVLAAREGENLATMQSPSRISMPIKLTVMGESANTYGPDIQDRFPQVFPKVPIIGKRMLIECLAYGRLPLTYSWTRLDAPMNPKAYSKDHGRVLVIDKAQLEDTGSYSCRVQGQSVKNKTVQVTMSGAPLFPYPLKNQHVDESQPLRWICNGIGVPTPTYTWYKNGVKLPARDDTLGTTVQRNILTFDKIQGDIHDGMYQCEASNSLGTVRTSAQLRAVAFAPTFARSPLPSTVRAAVGGNVTILCQPEASPRATLTWQRNGGGLGSNAIVLPNGALELSQLQIGDSGIYTCEATNREGSDKSSAELHVSEGTTLIETPADDDVIVNGTVYLACKASYDARKGDVVYVWKFFEHVIDFEREQVYSMPRQLNGDGTLYIVGAQHEQEGFYTCEVTSVMDKVSHGAYISVAGPPGEPSGVHAHQVIADERRVELWWQKGVRYIFPITKFTIQIKSEFEDSWVTVMSELPEAQTQIENFPDWRGVWISEGMAPGTSYSFRVLAGTSEIGYSSPSLPSPLYKMNSGAPIHAPSNVGGGGGSEGELYMKWDPLPRSQWGSDIVNYTVYYRLRDSKDFSDRWVKISNISGSELHKTVSSTLYFLRYEVKVQATNRKGSGPFSTSAIIYSAEKMPRISPLLSSASGINSTSAHIEWKDVNNTREKLGGALIGFQINYWLEDVRCSGRNEGNYVFLRIYGIVKGGDIIGLEPGGDYCFTLQLITNAGIGPKTDYYGVSVYDLPIARYPEYVTVVSHGRNSVRVNFKGVMAAFGEDPLLGYKVWWWDVRDDIRTANVTDLGRYNTGVVHGVLRDVIYKLRVIPYSNAGDGKKSLVVFFTLGGTVTYNPANTEIMNSAPSDVTSPHGCILVSLVWLAFLLGRTGS